MAIDIYFDMDGTLAFFNNKIDCYERLLEKDYFYNLSPIENMIEAVSLLLNINDDTMNIYLLSACINDDTRNQKNKWLDKYIPDLKINKRIYVSTDDDKSQYIQNNNNINILIDDYNKNLTDFHDGKKQIGIKLVNDINDVRKSWNGLRIDYRTSPIDLVHQIRTLAMKEAFRYYNIPIQQNMSLKQRMTTAKDQIESKENGCDLIEKTTTEKKQSEISK